MRINLFLMITSILVIISCGKSISKREMEAQLNQAMDFQMELNKHYRDTAHSPLVKDSIAGFDQLHFFEINEQFIVPASFERIQQGDTFEMKTSTDRLPLYVDYGILTFEFEGVSHQLHAYQNVAYSESEDYDSTLFIPFNDHTNGLESYGGGRYIDFPIPKGPETILNFNLCYNPYCAYNDRYSCPIPPDENKLEFRIEAGVLKYHD